MDAAEGCFSARSFTNIQFYIQKQGISELLTDLDKNEMFRIIRFEAYASGTYMQSGKESTFRKQGFGLGPLKADVDFGRMCIAGIQMLGGEWGYNEDMNLMEYDNYRLWFRRCRADEHSVQRAYFVYTDGSVQKQIELVSYGDDMDRLLIKYMQRPFTSMMVVFILDCTTVNTLRK